MPVVYRKLVRDRIPEVIQAEGRHTVIRVLDDGSYRQALLAKLVEEADEASHATADNLPSVIVDVLEVLRALTTKAGDVLAAATRACQGQAQTLRRLPKNVFLESVE